MTEDEARTKWCPMVRYLDFNGSIINNRGQYLEGVYPNTMECIASDCMLWRWMDTNVDDGKGGTKRDTRTYGFCGLAGDWFIGYGNTGGKP